MDYTDTSVVIKYAHAWGERLRSSQCGSPPGLVMWTMPNTLIPPDSPSVLGGWWMIQEKYDSDSKDKKKHNPISKKFSSKTKSQNKGHQYQSPSTSPRIPACLLLWFSNSVLILRPTPHNHTHNLVVWLGPKAVTFWVAFKDRSKENLFQAEPFQSL